MAQTLEGAQLLKLRAQIAIYFGKKDPSLATFQREMRKVMNGRKVLCECCGNTLFNPAGGHKQDCALVWSLLGKLKGEPLDAPL